MFLSSDYILANELSQKMDIHIANISMLKQKLENENNFNDIIKMNNCTFINTKSLALPNNIRHGIATNEFTDLSNKLPVTYVRTELNVSERELQNSGIIEGKVKIADKMFYVFTEDFINKTKKSIINVLDERDTLQCSSDGDIDGFIKLSKNKFITWYYY